MNPFSAALADAPVRRTAVPARPYVLLDFPDAGAPAGGLGFFDPVGTVVAGRVEEVRAALASLERAVARGLHAVGYVSYEAAPAFDAALVTRAPARLPLVWFGLFRAPVAVESGFGRNAGTVPDAAPPRSGGAAATPDLGGSGAVHHSGSAGRAPGAAASRFRVSAWTPSVTRTAYDAAVASIRQAIGRGDVYQVNHTFRLRSRFRGDARAFHRRLLLAQGRGYGAYLDLGRYRILSASPELFFRRTGTVVETRPMKGTARRGRSAEEDRAAAARLAASEKDRAENLMIVDLIRNDLGRVARYGTVRVPRLFQVECYPTVYQMTSTVVAEVPPDTSLGALFGALFPSGSVTGAPKIAAMKRICALEDSPREVYCGAIGWVRPGGDCVFSVAIRTSWLDCLSGRAEYGVGGGITWDSAAESEYEEALAKAAVLG